MAFCPVQIRRQKLGQFRTDTERNLFNHLACFAPCMFQNTGLLKGMVGAGGGGGVLVQIYDRYERLKLYSMHMKVPTPPPPPPGGRVW